MARGSVQLRHRKSCGATGKDARACHCGPTVYGVLEGEWSRIGYLEAGWRKADLAPFESQVAQMREALERGESFRPRRAVRMADYADQWFERLYDEAEAGYVSKLTYNTYEGQWTNHLAPAFGRKPLGAIDAPLIRAYVAAKLAQGLKPVTVNATLTPLSAMLSDAVADGLIDSNPAHRPRRTRHGRSRRHAIYADAERPTPKHLEPHEARALLAATPGEYRTMVLAALTTGFRRGELLGLRWENIRWADARIDLCGQLQNRQRVRCKYGSEREVVLYSGLARELGKHRQAEGYVFLGPDGQPWTNSGPEREFLAAAYTAAGLRRPGKMWHTLRHTYTSILAAGGIREDVRARLLGHKRQGTTALYTHMFEDAFVGVEEALAAEFAGLSAPPVAASSPKVDGILTSRLEQSTKMPLIAANEPVAELS